jgi:tetratricopeptide (TPR) repeat protein
MNFLTTSNPNYTRIMKPFLTHKPLALALSLGASLTVSAQISNQTTAIRISEDEVNLQDKYMSAVVQFQIGKLEGSAKLFQQVLDKNAKCDACAFQLARVYTLMGENQKAIDYAKRAVAMDGANKWYKMSLAESLEKIGKDKEAADIYKSLVEANAFDADYSREVYFRWVYCYVRLGEPQKAIKILEDLEKKMGISEDITNKKVTVYEALGDKKKAVLEIKKLADKFPQVIEYQLLAADYFMKIGEKTSGTDFYQRVLKIDPSNSKALLATSASQKPATGGDAAYLVSLKDLFKKPEIKIDDKIKTFLPYAQKIAEGKDKSLAIAGLELAQIIELVHPSEAKSYSLSGDMYYYNGKTSEAIEKYKKCTQLNKSIYPVWEQLMYAQEELGLYDDLLATSEQATDLFPNQAMTFFFNGTANEKKGKLAEAVSSLEQVLIMASKKPALKHDALVELGVTHSKSKAYDRADRAFDEALKLNNKSSIAMIKFAISLQQRGMAEKAKLLADEALKISLESDPSVLELYGDYIFKSGNKEDAVKYWTKAKERGAKSSGLEKKIVERNFVE